jgi:hypothetical protein
MAVAATFTNEVGRVVGRIAKKHPSSALRVEWNEGAPENLWVVTAVDVGAVYVVDDELGHWAPATVAELDLARPEGGERS